jgi:hypothetical protein
MIPAPTEERRVCADVGAAPAQIASRHEPHFLFFLTTLKEHAALKHPQNILAIYVSPNIPQSLFTAQTFPNIFLCVIERC